MQAFHHEILPPSGVQHAVSLNLTPSTVSSDSSSSTSSSASPDVKVLANLVTARGNYLWIYELREEAAVLPSLVEDERKHLHEKDRDGKRSRRGTEAVEGEVEMDAQGDGYVNMGTLKVDCLNICLFIP